MCVWIGPSLGHLDVDEHWKDVHVMLRLMHNGADARCKMSLLA